ncbi:hypothetical protein [uncultured Desulfuromonas sp.]|uniref:phage tail terminator protein n=1 Tax=uncultured Desulfuromonas sp. TaxID=181013 RepID=UPI002AABE52B|nr:hypothetical protein [uncultured Desulfuromonas sp.]
MDLLADRESIITALQGGVTAAKSVEPFAGDITELLRDTAKKPSLHVLYAGGNYGKQRIMGGASISAPTRKVWTILIAASGRRSNADTSTDVLALIAAIGEALTGLKLDTSRRLWPLQDEHLLGKNGVLIHGYDFEVEKEV